jgi:hypothetical protein
MCCKPHSILLARNGLQSLHWRDSPASWVTVCCGIEDTVLKWGAHHAFSFYFFNDPVSVGDHDLRAPWCRCDNNNNVYTLSHVSKFGYHTFNHTCPRYPKVVVPTPEHLPYRLTAVLQERPLNSNCGLLPRFQNMHGMHEFRAQQNQPLVYPDG